MGDDFFQALANPYRREIIRLLKWRSRTAGEIAAHFSISQPSISRHLDVLKRAEIITAERPGEPDPLYPEPLRGSGDGGPAHRPAGPKGGDLP